MTPVPAAPLHLHSSFWRIGSWLTVSVIAALLVHVLRAGPAEMAWSLGIFLAGTVALLRLVRSLPAFLGFLVVAAALVNGAGGAFSWFDDVAWYDEAAHAYTAFAGMAAIGYLHARDRAAARAMLVRWCFVVGLVLGVGWEVIEGLMGDLERWDTMSDIVLDGVGAALGGVLAKAALGRGDVRGTRGAPREHADARR